MRRSSLVALVAAACGLWASSARAEPIAGGSYAGRHAGGGPVTLTVSADGARVVAYRVADIPGDTCTFLAQGDLGIWEGAAIAGGTFAFEYRLYDAVVFTGGFPAAGTASGTIRLFNAAVPGVKPACDTGLVAWTATTAPAAPGTPPAGGAVPPPSGGSRATFRSQVTLRRRATRLVGRVGSPSPACRAGRRVQLVRGSRVVGSVRARRDGSFAVKRTAGLRGRRVRARVPRTTTSGVPGVICAAATSKRVRA